jgi:hypothetical protein
VNTAGSIVRSEVAWRLVWAPFASASAAPPLTGKSTLRSISSRRPLRPLHRPVCESAAGRGWEIEELWAIDPAVHQAGLVEHSQGWPLGRNAGGGSFVCHLNNTQIALGLIVHLNYEKPYLSPFDEFQRLKTHPAIARYLKGGDRIAHGAHVINEGSRCSLGAP